MLKLHAFTITDAYLLMRAETCLYMIVVLREDSLYVGDSFAGTRKPT